MKRFRNRQNESSKDGPEDVLRQKRRIRLDRGYLRQGGRRLLSLALCASMLVSYGAVPVESSAAVKQNHGAGVAYLASSRISKKKLPKESCIYFGTASAQVEERGEYAVRLYREGDLDKAASVDIHTVDLTAVYGKDYELVMEDVEETGDGVSLLEKYAKGQEIRQPDETQAYSAKQMASVSSQTETTDQQKDAPGQPDTAGDAQQKAEEEADNGEHTLMQALSDALIADSVEQVEASSKCTVNFAAGEEEKIVRFRILEDEESEGNEGFSMLLVNPQNAQLFEVTSAAITIVDDEEAEHSQVSFTSDVYQAKGGKVQLTVTRSGAEYSVCDMTVLTCEDTAHAGQNYTAQNETLAFAPYETEKTITMDVAGEGRFSVMLTSLRACTKGAHTKAFVEIGAQSQAASEQENAAGMQLMANTAGAGGQASSDEALRGTTEAGKQASSDEALRGTTEAGKQTSSDEALRGTTEAGKQTSSDEALRETTEAGGQAATNEALREAADAGGQPADKTAGRETGVKAVSAQSTSDNGSNTKLRGAENKLSFGVEINGKAYSVEYSAGDVTGKIMDNSYNPALQVGTYYFSLDDSRGGMFKYGFKTGNQPGWRGNVRSEYMEKEQFGKLEYYSSWVSDKGGAYTESVQTVPGVYFQYFVNDWRSKTGDFGGQRARLEICSKKYENVDGKFDRCQDKGVIANTANGNLNANLKFKIWALDEDDKKTPKSYVEFYGLCAMSKKYHISLLPTPEKTFRTGTKDSSQSVVPVQVSVNCGAVDPKDPKARYVYANMDQNSSNMVFSISDTQIGGHNGKYGYITGYQISVDPSSTDKRRQVTYPEDFVEFLKKKKGSGTSTGVDFSSSAVDAEIKKVNANLDTVPYDAYFISWIDQVQADIVKEGSGYMQILKFTPRIEYNDVTVEVLDAKGKGTGHFKDAQLSKKGKYTFHAGDSLNLDAVVDNPDKYHVVGYEVSDNKGITFNTITDGADLFLESFKSYQIRPVIAENDNAIEVRFTDKEAENGLEIQGFISPSLLKGTVHEGKHILNLNPGAKKVEDMMKPVPGKDYSFSIAVKEKESGGYIQRPQIKIKSKNTVYHTQQFFMVAGADVSDNIVEVGLSKVNRAEANYDYDISGTLVSAFAPIRSNGEGMKNLPVSNYTLSVGDGNQQKDSKTGKWLVESASSLTGGTGQYSMRIHGGCNGDIIPMLISNGISNGQVADVKLTNTRWSSSALSYQVNVGNTQLSYPYHMPAVSSITYAYNNSANNQRSDNRENSVCIYDDTLNVTAKVNTYGRQIKEAVFTVYTVTNQKTEYHATESDGNRDTFVCTIPKMTENLHSGDRIMVRLVDKEELFSGSGSDVVLDDTGQPITGQSVPIQYPDVDTGLVFYVENTIIAPQSYDLDNSIPVDVPLIGKSTGNANSGLITFGKTNWANNTGYTLQVGLDMLYSTIMTPNSAQKIQNYNNFNQTVLQASQLNNTNAEDIIYQQTQKDKNASLGNVSLKKEKDTMEGITETLKKDPTSKMKGASAGLNKNPMWSVDVAILAAFDFVYNPQSEQFLFSCGSVVIGGTFTFNKTMYTIVYGVPLFLNFSATLQGNATIAYTTEGGKEALSAGDFDSYAGNLAQRLQAPKSSLSLMLSGKVQAGVGMCGVVSARGYVSLGIQFDIPISDDPNVQGGALLSGSGGLGIDMLLLTINVDIAKFFTGFGSLKNQQKFDFFGGLISTDAGRKSTNKEKSLKAADDIVLKQSSESEQVLMHAYSSGTSDMGSFGKQINKRGTLQPVAVHTLLDQAAERTRPQIIPLDGGQKMIVFIGSRGGAELNSAALYYSIYDGMQWKTPKIVSDDGTVDSTPAMVRAGDKVILAWADANRTFTDADQPKDKLSALEISVAVYDSKTDTMGSEITLTDDGWMDFAPQLVVDGTKVYCSYMKRDLSKVTKNEDLIDFAGIDTTMAYRVYDFGTADGQKSGEQRIAISHETLSDPLVMDWHSALAKAGGKTYLLSTYTIDEDVNLQTNEDRELYLEIYCVDDGKRYYPIRISRDNINQSNPKLTDIDGTLYLTWMESGYLFRLMDVSDLLTALFATEQDGVATGGDETHKIAVNTSVYRNSDEKDTNWYQRTAQEFGMEESDYENSIYERLANNEFPAESANFSQNANLMTSVASYVLTSDGDDLYIFFTDFGQDQAATGVEIYGVRYERAQKADGNADGAWGFGKAVQLTHSNKVIDELDLYMEKDGSVSAISNYFDQWIDDDGKIQYGTNQLVEIDFATRNSLEIKNDQIVFPSKITAGKKDQLSFEVVNNGLLTAKGFDYTVSQGTDGTGTLIASGHVDGEWKSGQSETVTVPWDILQDVSNTSVQVSVVETGVQDKTAYSTVTKVPCESRLHFVQTQVLWDGRQPYIEAVVENAGAVEAKEAKGTLSMVDQESQKTKAYADFIIPALASGEETVMKIPFTPGIDDFNWLGLINLKLEATDANGVKQAEAYDKLVVSEPACVQINGGQKQIKLDSGKKAQLQVAVAPWSSLAKAARFYSSDESVAAVNQKGVVTGVRNGEADVYAYYDHLGLSTSIHVKVSGKAAQTNVAVKKIVPAKKQVALRAGKSKKVKFTLKTDPSAGAGKSASVTASVSGNRNVSAKITGNAVKIKAGKKAVKGSKAVVTLKAKNAKGKTVKAKIRVTIK